MIAIEQEMNFRRAMGVTIPWSTTHGGVFTQPNGIATHARC